MPTYQYECESCGFSFEKFQNMSEAKLVQCPECGKESLVRLIGSGTGIIFKGTGFYQTDYKNSGSVSAPACPAKDKGGKKSSACQGCPAAQE